MTSDPLLQEHRAAILALAAAHGLENVRVFGSRARGEAAKASDLDLLVTCPTGTSLLDLIGLQQDVEDLTGCKVEVLSDRGLSPHVEDRILAEARPL